MIFDRTGRIGTRKQAAALVAAIGLLSILATAFNRISAGRLASHAGLINVSAVMPVIRVADWGPDGTAHATFYLENHGMKTVALESITTSCGCTVASAANKSLAPAEIVPVQVSIDGSHLSTGLFAKTVLCTVREGTLTKIIELEITGVAMAKNELDVFPQHIRIEYAIGGGVVERSLYVYGPPEIIAALPDSIAVELPNAQPHSLALPASASRGLPMSKRILLKIMVSPRLGSEDRKAEVNYSIGNTIGGSLFDVTVSQVGPV